MLHVVFLMDGIKAFRGLGFGNLCTELHVGCKVINKAREDIQKKRKNG